MIKINMPSQAKSVIDALNAKGFEAYIVGGCVRDSLLNKEVHDWDVTTNASPEQMKFCFSGNRIIETGVKHGTLTVIMDGLPVEVTAYRVDGEYADHRRPDTVEFTSDLRSDLERRDFTVNALAYHPKAGLIDCFNGLGDLEAKRLACVGNPEKRFNEDALRILRAVRFVSVLGFSVEEKTRSEMQRQKPLLDFISAERVASELKRTLNGDNVLDALMSHTLIFTQIIPELAPMLGFEQHNEHHCYDVFTHTARAVSAAPRDEVLRLALLFHDIGKPATFSQDEQGTGHFYAHAALSAKIADRALTRLRFDNATRERVVYLIARHCDRIYPEPKLVKRALNKMGEEKLRQHLLLNRADCMAQTPAFLEEKLERLDAVTRILDELIAQNAAFSLRDLKINGDDLLELGYKPGKKLGETLNCLLELVIDEKLENDREALLREAQVVSGK